MVFIFGYLAIFDTSLIMMLEYSDILKFILVGVCLGLGLLSAFANVIFASLYVISEKSSIVWKVTGIIGLPSIIFLQILSAWLEHSPDFQYYVFRAITVFFRALVLFGAFKASREDFLTTPALSIFLILTMLYLFVYALGSTFWVVRWH